MSRAVSFADEYPFASHLLELPAGRLHYLDEGPRDGPPILMVHGNPTWSFLWRKLVLQLRERYRCIAVDHLGCGLSDKPADFPYTLEAHIENLERLVLELDLERVTLAVHDWGGAIGMGVAGRQPERFARFLITNTAAFRAKEIPARIALCRIPVLGPLAVRGLNAFARAATSMAVEKPLSPAAKAGFLAPYGSWGDRRAIQAFVEDIPLVPAHPSYATLVEVERGLAQFRGHPLGIVWGDRDWCFTPGFRSRWMHRFPAADVRIFADAGHYVLEDAGTEALEWIEDFLERHPL